MGLILRGLKRRVFLLFLASFNFIINEIVMSKGGMGANAVAAEAGDV